MNEQGEVKMCLVTASTETLYTSKMKPLWTYDISKLKHEQTR